MFTCELYSMKSLYQVKPHSNPLAPPYSTESCTNRIEIDNRRDGRGLLKPRPLVMRAQYPLPSILHLPWQFWPWRQAMLQTYKMLAGAAGNVSKVVIVVPSFSGLYPNVSVTMPCCNTRSRIFFYGRIPTNRRSQLEWSKRYQITIILK